MHPQGWRGVLSQVLHEEAGPKEAITSAAMQGVGFSIPAAASCTVIDARAPMVRGEHSKAVGDGTMGAGLVPLRRLLFSVGGGRATAGAPGPEDIAAFGSSGGIGEGLSDAALAWLQSLGGMLASATGRPVQLAVSGNKTGHEGMFSVSFVSDSVSEINSGTSLVQLRFCKGTKSNAQALQACVAALHGQP